MDLEEPLIVEGQSSSLVPAEAPLVVHNELWIDVKETMARPMSPELNTRTIAVRLETMSQGKLACAYAAVCLGLVGPFIFVWIARATASDDDTRFRV